MLASQALKGSPLALAADVHAPLLPPPSSVLLSSIQEATFNPGHRGNFNLSRRKSWRDDQEISAAMMSLAEPQHLSDPRHTHTHTHRKFFYWHSPPPPHQECELSRMEVAPPPQITLLSVSPSILVSAEDGWRHGAEVWGGGRKRVWGRRPQQFLKHHKVVR